MRPKERLRKNLTTLKAIEPETRSQLIDRVIEQINISWCFDKYQQHLSNWHHKQDLLEQIEKMK